MILLFTFLIGVLAGLRSMTPPAAIAWAVHLGWLKLTGPLALIGSLPAVAILSLFAAVEFVLDKLPNTPSRTALPGLIARVVTGGLAGACVSLGGGKSLYAGAALGMIGGLVGSFAGYQARTRLVRKLAIPDIYVASIEDLITIAGSLLIVSRF